MHSDGRLGVPDLKIVIKLRDLLRQRGMTQKELAQKSELREATISELVNSERRVLNKEHLTKIAEVLEIKDIRELVDFEE